MPLRMLAIWPSPTIAQNYRERKPGAAIWTSPSNLPRTPRLRLHTALEGSYRFEPAVNDTKGVFKMKDRGRCNWNRIRVGIVLSLFTLIVAGCGQRMGDITGTVSYKGKALPSGQVTFFGADKQVVGGSSIVEGKYKVLKVPPGAVKITVRTPPPPPPAGQTPKQNAPQQREEGMPPPLESIAIPPKYSSPDQSGLTYEVKPGSQTHPIDLN